MAGEPILIVDDSVMNLRLAEYILHAVGFSIRTATNADEALAAIAELPPRLILMDLQMPGMNGFDLTRRLKADVATRDIIIIAVTAYAMKGDEEKARAAGCDDYVAKPIDKDELRATVARHLAGR